MSFAYITKDPDLYEIEQLISTYDYLYGREDVVDDAKQKAADMKDKAKEKASEIKEKAKTKGAEIQQKLIKVITKFIGKILEETSFEARLEKNKDEHLKKCTSLAASIKTAFPDATKNKVTLSSKFNMTALKELVNSDNKSMTGGVEILSKVDEFLQAYVKSVESGDIVSLDAKKDEVKKLITEIEDPELKKTKDSITSKEPLNLVDNGTITDHGRALEELCGETTTKKLVENIASCVAKARSLKNVINQLEGKLKSGSGADKSTDVATFNKAQTTVLKLVYTALKATVSLPVDCYKAITKTGDMVVEKASKGNKDDKEDKKDAEQPKKAGESYMKYVDDKYIDTEFQLAEEQLDVALKKLQGPTDPIPGFEELYVSIPTDHTHPNVIVGMEGIIGDILSAIGRFFKAIFNFFGKLFGKGGSADNNIINKVEEKKEVIEKMNETKSTITEVISTAAKDQLVAAEIINTVEEIDDGGVPIEQVLQSVKKDRRGLSDEDIIVIKRYRELKKEFKKLRKTYQPEPYKLKIKLSAFFEYYKTIRDVLKDKHEYMNQLMINIEFMIAGISKTTIYKQQEDIDKGNKEIKTATYDGIEDSGDKLRRYTESVQRNLKSVERRLGESKNILDISKKMYSPTVHLVIIDDNGKYNDSIKQFFTHNLISSLNSLQNFITNDNKDVQRFPLRLNLLENTLMKYLNGVETIKPSKDPEEREYYNNEIRKVNEITKTAFNLIKQIRVTVHKLIYIPSQDFLKFISICETVTKKVTVLRDGIFYWKQKNLQEWIEVCKRYKEIDRKLRSSFVGKEEFNEK